MSENEIREPIQKRSIEKKEKIIQAGFELICDKGYYNTNTAEIAKSAGVSTGIGDHDSKYNGAETDEVQGDEQFEIDDNRSLNKMYEDMADEGLQPVLNDYLYV